MGTTKLYKQVLLSNYQASSNISSSSRLMSSSLDFGTNRLLAAGISEVGAAGGVAPIFRIVEEDGYKYK